MSDNLHVKLSGHHIAVWLDMVGGGHTAKEIIEGIEPIIHTGYEPSRYRSALYSAYRRGHLRKVGFTTYPPSRRLHTVYEIDPSWYGFPCDILKAKAIREITGREVTPEVNGYCWYRNTNSGRAEVRLKGLTFPCHDRREWMRRHWDDILQPRLADIMRERKPMLVATIARGLGCNGITGTQILTVGAEKGFCKMIKKYNKYVYWVML